MSATEAGDPFDDGRLTAYLDGELPAAERARLEAAVARDSGLRARLERLRAGGRPFDQAFEPLLEAAPVERLEARLAAAGAPHAPPRSRTKSSWLVRRPVAAMAAAIACAFLAGVAADRAVEALRPAPQAEAGGWRQAVAGYVALYTSQSLAAVPEDERARAAELAGVAAGLGVPLAPDRVDVPGASLRRAQLLQYDGKPLGQLAYLDPAYGPMAFCLIRNGKPDAPLKTETRGGFNVVFWAEAGIGYMLIARAPLDALVPRAETLASRI